MEERIKGADVSHDKFHRDLEDLKARLLKLAQLAETAIRRSVSAFLNPDRETAREVIAGDKAINDLEEAIDEECIRLIALFQPVALDLRQLMAVDHIIAELERIGDLAVNIAEESLDQEGSWPVHPLLSQMAQEVLEMVRQSLQSFINQDARLARQVCQEDTRVDEMDQEIIQDLIRDMTEDRAIPSCQSQISVVRHLERVGDHATNIAEQVVYMVEGEIVRHRCQG
ncbi:MAG: phosphate signaling complex protein PhoU [Deltaproteobacteria bacterium]|nr:phosphate signaling complex protein PhoU [Deltaproteobacteria bacterium]